MTNVPMRKPQLRFAKANHSVCRLATLALTVVIGLAFAGKIPDSRQVTASGASTSPSAHGLVCREQAQAPSWAIPFGEEFWRRSSSAPARSPVGAPAAVPNAVNVGEIIDRVSHAFETDASSAR
ncbi:MAG: hypothetical protein L0Z50_32960, partial [Verrucomicrobiales bacterium]|nr:hypothetical protein [Verrucomicrobiales bacterium]